MNCPKCNKEVAIYDGIKGEKLYLCPEHGRVRELEKNNSPEGLIYEKAAANSYLPIGQIGEYEEDSVLELSLLGKVLDEAKVDFPKNLRIMLQLDVKGVKDDQMILLKNWFEKWFGALNNSKPTEGQ